MSQGSEAWAYSCLMGLQEPCIWGGLGPVVRAEDSGAAGVERLLEVLGTHRQLMGNYSGGVGKEIMRAISALPSEVFSI